MMIFSWKYSDLYLFGHYLDLFRHRLSIHNLLKLIIVFIINILKNIEKYDVEYDKFWMTTKMSEFHRGWLGEVRIYQKIATSEKS